MFCCYMPELINNKVYPYNMEVTLPPNIAPHLYSEIYVSMNSLLQYQLNCHNNHIAQYHHQIDLV